MKDDKKGETVTPEGGRIAYRVGSDGLGYYYDMDGALPFDRNWGPFPTRDIARRWHEEPTTIDAADIVEIRKVQGYVK